VACHAKAQELQERDHRADQLNPRHPLYTGDKATRDHASD
jgi:hypothetical protein